MSGATTHDGPGRRLGLLVRDRIDSLLRSRGYELRRIPANLPIDQYIDFNSTLTGAEHAGLSVGDFIDASHNQPGATAETIDKLAGLGVFEGSTRRICEIGPGSGRYLAKTISWCEPEYYEIYETSHAWRDWLAHEYPVVVQPADGRSLRPTPSGSIDLVHAHKVFSTVATMKSVRYMIEMMRVAVPGGRVVFDVVTEDCLDQAVIDAWVGASNDYETYPAFMPKQFVLDLFARNGFSCMGTFIVAMRPGTTQYVAFRRDGRIGQHE